MANKKKFYITTPIYYVNAPIHLGGAYTTIAADVLARWHKVLGEEVFFLTGTDEHGQKIQEAAEKADKTPKEFVNNIANGFKEAFKMLNISNDNFIRTTDKYHIDEVNTLLQTLYDKKLIYKGFYESYYCVGCEQYLTESDLVDGKCPLHNREPELKKEGAYLFKLSNFQDKLLKLIKSGEFEILPKIRTKEIITFIETGLKDISISRLKEKISWGIELPFDKKHTAWVWPDALWNYVSGLRAKDSKNFNKFWPADVQLMAKDIFRVHATIWPALLLGADYKLPKTLFIHGYFTINGQKMSKSLGNVIDPIYLTKQYGVDSVRYYLMRNLPFGSDGDVSEQGLINRRNSELADKLGNLISRVSTLAEKGIQKIPNKLIKKLKIKQIEKQMENYELDKALNLIFEFIDNCNLYVQENKIWELDCKNKEQKLYELVDSIKAIPILLWPFIPETSEKIAKTFGFKVGSNSFKEINKTYKIKKIKKSEILFKKIENITQENKSSNDKINIKSFFIDPKLSQKGINVCMAILNNVNIKNKNSELEKLKKESVERILTKNILDKKILEGYKEFYREHKKDFKTAAESLIELIKKNKRYPNINTVVDVYNIISAESLLSVGAHDLSKIRGNVKFLITNGDEKFVPLGEKEEIKVESGEYAFCDEEGILCRMDIKQNNKTKITKDTKNLLIYAQGNKNTSKDYIKENLINICELVIKICGGSYKLIPQKK